MKTHYFVVIADGLDPADDATYEAFFEAGCDDAGIAWQDGVFVLNFQRDARRFDEALLTAYRDVSKAGATVSRFEPDHLVTVAEISERSGLSTSRVEELRDGGAPAPFPPAVGRVTAEEPLWDWAQVSTWLHRRGLVEREAVIEARVIWEANTTLLLRQMQGANFEQVFEGLRASAV